MQAYGTNGVLCRRRAVDDEARAGQRLKQRRQRRIADPIVCPGNAPTQRQHRIGIERQHPVEARAQLAPGVGRVATIEIERKAVGDQPGLGVAGRVEVLPLDRRVGRDPGVGECLPLFILLLLRRAAPANRSYVPKLPAVAGIVLMRFDIWIILAAALLEYPRRDIDLAQKGVGETPE
jgi:hypothetical protein